MENWNLLRAKKEGLERGESWKKALKTIGKDWDAEKSGSCYSDHKEDLECEETWNKLRGNKVGLEYGEGWNRL